MGRGRGAGRRLARGGARRGQAARRRTPNPCAQNRAARTDAPSPRLRRPVLSRLRRSPSCRRIAPADRRAVPYPARRRRQSAARSESSSRFRRFLVPRPPGGGRRDDRRRLAAGGGLRRQGFGLLSPSRVRRGTRTQRCRRLDLPVPVRQPQPLRPRPSGRRTRGARRTGRPYGGKSSRRRGRVAGTAGGGHSGNAPRLRRRGIRRDGSPGSFAAGRRTRNPQRCGARGVDRSGRGQLDADSGSRGSGERSPAYGTGTGRGPRGNFAGSAAAAAGLPPVSPAVDAGSGPGRACRDEERAHRRDRSAGHGKVANDRERRGGGRRPRRKRPPGVQEQPRRGCRGRAASANLSGRRRRAGGIREPAGGAGENGSRSGERQAPVERRLETVREMARDEKARR